MTKEDLEGLKITGLSIIKENGSLIYILFFQTMEQAEQVMRDLITKEEFGFEIAKSEAGEYSFRWHFAEYTLRFDTKYTLENYPPVGWIGEDIPTFFSAGQKLEGGGQYIRSAVLHPLDKR